MRFYNGWGASMDFFDSQEFMSFVFAPILLGIILFIFWILGYDPLDK
jgi:hypothetical protein|tara:strand:- start:70 stop:210 length:141 start_codon:yes stop_codon:yes gene_type:complete